MTIVLACLYAGKHKIEHECHDQLLHAVRMIVSSHREMSAMSDKSEDLRLVGLYLPRLNLQTGMCHSPDHPQETVAHEGL